MAIFKVFAIFLGVVLMGIIVSESYSLMMYDSVRHESRHSPGEYRVVEKRCVGSRMFTVGKVGEVKQDQDQNYRSVSC